MVDGIKGFLEVHKDTGSYFIIVESLPYLFRNANEGMTCRVFFPKPKLFFVKGLIEFYVFIYSRKYYFFKNFTDVG